METQRETTIEKGCNGQHGGKAEGRARVQALLWDRIDQAGMTRAKGETVDAHAAMRKRVSDRLAYMGPKALAVLADMILTNAIGAGGARPKATIWPETSILSHAHALQSPPVFQMPIVTSWLASIEGPAAIADGFEVELYRHLAKHGRPPLAYDLRLIREAAEDAARQILLIGGRIERGAADPVDLQWLEAYKRDRQAVAAIVVAGQIKRDGAAA
jgi:hypothetical protein